MAEKQFIDRLKTTQAKESEAL